MSTKQGGQGVTSQNQRHSSLLSPTDMHKEIHEHMPARPDSHLGTHACGTFRATELQPPGTMTVPADTHCATASLTAGKDSGASSPHHTRMHTARLRSTGTQTWEHRQSQGPSQAHSFPAAGKREEMPFPLLASTWPFSGPEPFLLGLALDHSPRLLRSLHQPSLCSLCAISSLCTGPSRDSTSIRSKSEAPTIPSSHGWDLLFDLTPQLCLSSHSDLLVLSVLGTAHTSTCLRGFALAISSVSSALSSNSHRSATLPPLGLCSNVPDHRPYSSPAPLGRSLSSPPTSSLHSIEHLTHIGRVGSHVPPPPWNVNATRMEFFLPCLLPCSKCLVQPGKHWLLSRWVLSE